MLKNDNNMSSYLYSEKTRQTSKFNRNYRISFLKERKKIYQYQIFQTEKNREQFVKKFLKMKIL